MSTLQRKNNTVQEVLLIYNYMYVQILSIIIRILEAHDKFSFLVTASKYTLTLYLLRLSTVCILYCTCLTNNHHQIAKYIHNYV